MVRHHGQLMINIITDTKIVDYLKINENSLGMAPLGQRAQRSRRKLTLVEELQQLPDAIALERIRNADALHLLDVCSQKVEQPDVGLGEVLHQRLGAHAHQHLAYIEKERRPVARVL